MFKPALVSADQFRAPQQAMDEAMVNKVFKVMHGSYGNLFLSKFATGVLDANKRDLGVASARKVWAYSLASFSEATLMSALEQSLAKHGEFPPSLPQFVAFCKSCAPRPVYRDTLPPPAVDRSEQLRKFKERAMETRAAMAALNISNGLSLLKRAIADSVANAGGDEAKELSRLDQMLAPKQQEVSA